MAKSTTYFAYGMHIARTLGIKRAITYWRAAQREPEAMRDWLAFLEQQIAAEYRDSMMMRVLRPYMRQHFTSEQRRQLLREHFAVMVQYFVPAARHGEEPGMVIATLVGKNEATYTLHLGINTSKEGELAFGIYDVSGHYLAKMAVTIGRDEANAPVLWIGGLQGAKPPMGRDEVVKATKDLFGLRPKGAVMLAAQTFASALGLTALRAPGNEAHISQQGLKRLRSKRKIYADYGQFWEELGGTKIADEEYTIPVIPQVRDVSEVKPHKRSEWKKRQAISEALVAGTLNALTSIRRS